MQSKATSIDAYLDEVPADRRAMLERLRALCRRSLNGFEEGMDYGMPTFKRDGVPEIAFASQKNYISLYVLKTHIVQKHKAALMGLDVGKSCIKYTKPEKIDFAVVERLLNDTRDDIGGRVC